MTTPKSTEPRVTTWGDHTADCPLLVLAHGAGAGQHHPWMVAVARGLAARGVTVVTFDFPYMQNQRRLPDRAPVLEIAFSAVWREVLGLTPARRRFAGGKSMGGRIATQAAAKNLFQPAPDGVVCFGYPLHPPGKPDVRRDAHFADFRLPLLFVHGTKDPFGSPAEMTSLAASISQATLKLVDGGDHSLQVRRGSTSESAAVSGALDEVASWLLA